MNFLVKNGQFINAKSNCLVVAVFADKKLSKTAKKIDNQSNKFISSFLKTGDFSAKVGDACLLYQLPNVSAERVLLLGMGKEGELTLSDFKKAVLALAKRLKPLQSKTVQLALEEVPIKKVSSEEKCQQTILALHGESYAFTRFKSETEKARTIKYLWLSNEKSIAKLKTTATQTLAMSLGLSTTQDLGNTPGNVCTPSYLAEYAKKLAKRQSKLACKVLNESQMRKLKMGALLSVAQGSSEEAKLICLEYKGGQSKQAPIALVGKGVTFDTGGASLKPSASMMGMKFDMCGAATVMGVMHAISAMQLPINVVGLLACAENMPSHNCSRPDDIVTSMSGLTVEISNTDAEGRLVLCDALTYCQKTYKPRGIIDIATLTGACVVALGSHASGLYSNQQSMADALLAAGQQILDKAWQMPLWDEYKPQLESKIADVNNVGGPQAGSVTAAYFLSHFINEVDWAHLDIAGTAATSMGKDGLATGRPLPLLVQYLINQCG